MPERRPGEEDVIYCQNCGQQLLSTANFCDRCGSEVSDQAAGGGDEPTPTEPAREEEQPEESADPVPEPAPEDADEESFWSRRRILAGAAGTALVGGVGASFALGLTSPSHQAAGPEAWDGPGEGANLTNQTTTATVSLESGEYVGREFQVFGQALFALEVNHQEGGPIDVYVMDSDDIDRYQKGENIDYYGSLSATDVRSTRIEGRIGAGTYALVIDNTPVFGAEPDGNAVVEIEFGLLTG